MDADSTPDRFIFRGFHGRLVAKNPDKTIPYGLTITHAQYMRYLSLWFGGVIDLSIQEFRS
jgi:hypothetical protein